MRQASMQQVALLRGAPFRPSSRSLGRSPSLQWLQRGNAVKRAFTTRPLVAVRPTRDRVALLAGERTALPGTQQCRSLTSSAKEDGKEDGEEQTGTYSEADHEHAVISAFDLLYVKSVTYTLTRSRFTDSALWPFSNLIRILPGASADDRRAALSALAPVPRIRSALCVQGTSSSRI